MQKNYIICPNCGVIHSFKVEISEVVSWTVKASPNGWDIDEHNHNDTDPHFEGVFCVECSAELGREAKDIAEGLNLI